MPAPTSGYSVGADSVTISVSAFDNTPGGLGVSVEARVQGLADDLYDDNVYHDIATAIKDIIETAYPPSGNPIIAGINFNGNAGEAV